jgi:ABC-type bacteriocin/lantibiotic exporter with double-glycine peptidase domain
MWRLPQNDGVNTLYLQLRLLGYSGGYANLRDQMGGIETPASLDAVEATAERLGYRLVAKKLTSQDLASWPSILMVHQEEAVGHGCFSLLLGRVGDQAALISGSDMEIHLVPFDAFLRSWSGYALVEEPSPKLTQGLWRILGTACVCGTIGFVALNRHRHRGKRREKACRTEA